MKKKKRMVIYIPARSNNLEELNKHSIKQQYEALFPDYEIILVSHDVTIVDDNKVVDDILLG